VIADLHNHFLMANANLIVAAAAAAGVGVIALTEHGQHVQELREAIPYLATRWPPEGPPVSLDHYVELVVDAQDRAEIDVLIGLELDARPGHDAFEATVAEVVDSRADLWDVLIGSVHVLSDDTGIEDARDEGADDGVWQDYVDLQVRAVASGRYDVLAHPTRLGLGVPRAPADIVELLARVTTAAALHHVAVELNGNDLEQRPDLVELLIASAAASRATISLGSDAHLPRSAGRVRAAAPLLRAAGIEATACFSRRKLGLQALPPTEGP
jgi:histidinol phosphatase-like PHP family hydrolase